MVVVFIIIVSIIVGSIALVHCRGVHRRRDGAWVLIDVAFSGLDGTEMDPSGLLTVGIPFELYIGAVIGVTGEAIRNRHRRLVAA